MAQNIFITYFDSLFFLSVLCANWFCLFHLVLVPPMPLTMLMPHMTFWGKGPGSGPSIPIPRFGPNPSGSCNTSDRQLAIGRRLVISDRAPAVTSLLLR